MADYSPDVELDDKGRLVLARDVERGEALIVPRHMLGAAFSPGVKGRTLRTFVTPEEFRRLLG